MTQTEMFPAREYPTQKSGPVTSYFFTSGSSSEPPSGLVINDACHPIEVASCLWEGKRAFFHAILQDTKSIPSQAVLHLWKNTPEKVRERLLGWAPQYVVGALIDEVERRTGELPQWLVVIDPLDHVGYYTKNSERREKMLKYSEKVLPEPSEFDHTDPAYVNVGIGKKNNPNWGHFRFSAAIHGMAVSNDRKGWSSEGVWTWTTK